MRLEDGEEHDLGTFQTFKVDDADRESPITPESIEGDVIVTAVDETEPDSNKETRLLSKKAVAALYSLAAFTTLLVTTNIVLSIVDFWRVHWLLGAVVATAAGVMALLTGRAIYQWIKGKDGVEVVRELQVTAQSLKDGSNDLKLGALLERISLYYQNTHLDKRCSQIIEDLPDYLTDKERLEQFETRFLTPLDRQAEKIIQRFSVQTGAAVAFSPIPAVDAVLTMWRNVMMLNAISFTYGVKPTLANRLRLLVSVTKNMAYAGLSQGGMDAVDLSSLPLVNTGAKAIQGFGAGIATARIGHECAKLCRPILLEADDRLFGKFLTSLKLLLGKRVFITRNGSE